MKRTMLLESNARQLVVGRCPIRSVWGSQWLGGVRGFGLTDTHWGVFFLCLMDRDWDRHQWHLVFHRHHYQRLDSHRHL